MVVDLVSLAYQNGLRCKPMPGSTAYISCSLNVADAVAEGVAERWLRVPSTHIRSTNRNPTLVNTAGLRFVVTGNGK